MLILSPFDGQLRKITNIIHPLSNFLFYNQFPVLALFKSGLYTECRPNESQKQPI